MDPQWPDNSNELVNADGEESNAVLPPETSEHNNFEDIVEEVRSKTSDAGLSDSIAGNLLSPVRSRSHDFDSKRKFRIVGLKHPGEWKSHEKLQELLTRTDQFHIWFDPSKTKGGIKNGGVSLTFDCPEAARKAFSDAQQFIIDGAQVKLLASKSFYEPPRRPNHCFTVPEDAATRDRTLYALHLLESTSANVLETIFNDMEKVEILPLGEKRNQAEVLMVSREAADAAKDDADGFELGDGEENSVVKVLTASEYLDFISKCSTKGPALILSPTHSTSGMMLGRVSRSNSTASTCSKPQLMSPPIRVKEREEVEEKKEEEEEEEKVVRKKPAAVPLPLPTEIPEVEPTISEIAGVITSIVEEERINWAEMNEKEEMYELVDKASYRLGGVRDDLLLNGLLSVMEGARGTSEESSWMRRHLDGLIKIWKKEVSSHASGVSFERSTRVPLQSRVISVIGEKKKRKRGGGSAAMRAQMGLGAILEAARAKFATEEGELDIEETEDGGIVIGDVPLSFESWARFNKQPLKRVAPKEEPASTETTRENRKAKRAKLEEEKRKKKEEREKEEKKEKEKRPMKELEEGEMDSDEEGEKRGGASSSSSSSSSSDSDEGGNSRRRRMRRRKGERKKPPTLPPLFQSLYDNRVAIISQLSVEHRIAFSKVLTQFVNQKGGIDSKQQQALMSYMSNFGR